ncbi:MAG TPA: aryldialkylphosphatase [Amnibacterium sp.]|jgi:phosphotriesterase-related protein|nr:aryldialkylphosphatase [Amnibacterium sp.]
MSRVRTALGDVGSGELGRVDYHEHLFQVSPLLPEDDLDDERASGEEAAALAATGFEAMVDATPTGLGRRPEAAARIAAAAGLHVVLSSGAHREEHYGDGHPLLGRSERELADAFRTDVAEGMRQTDDAAAAPALGPGGRPVRAGLLKAGIGYWRITPFEHRVLAAVAAAHVVTGAPVMVHLEHGSAGFEVIEVLAAGGVPASAIVLAHVDRAPDPVLHAELAAAGAYLGYDGWARYREWPDSVIVACVTRAIELGAGERVLLGGDVARRTRYVAYGGMPGLAYLGRRAVPALRAEIGEAALRTMLVDNPARLLARF